MMMRGPYREITPAGAQRVSLRLPPRARVEGVKLLRRGIPAEYSIEQGRLELIVPEIADIEIVAVDLAAC